ncbi:MAG: glycosyltransferase [Alphaproteobacteria bacterium]|nr:glycosyltransferase [Alphaproteobacteria bacterium]
MIYAIIPTFNRKGHLLRCLECLSKQDTEVIAIISDSGSTDGSAKEVAEKFPDAVYLNGHPDLWWTGATNLGLSYFQEHAAPNDFFLLLNDDTEFSSHYCGALLTLAMSIQNSIIGSACVDIENDDILIDGGITVNWLTAHNKILNYGTKLSDFSAGHAETVSVLPGRGTLYPASVLDKVGLLDDTNLPHYGADYEYSRRCTFNDYLLLVSYDAVILSDTTTTGIHRHGSKWTLEAVRQFFWERRSACNLPDRYQYSFRTATHVVKGCIFFLCSVIRLTKRFLTT